MKNSKKNKNFLEEEPGGAKEEPGGGKKITLAEGNWQTDYKNSLQSIADLITAVPIPEEEIPFLKQVVKVFPMRIPAYYFSLIGDVGDSCDPIRKQCVPSIEEIKESAGDKVDPLGEEKTSPFPCLVHRYPDRVLLLVSSNCFMYCRHCTRKRLWKNRISDPTLRDIEKALAYVREHKNIREIVVSGGDPLTLPTEKLDYILSVISRCENIEVVRIGTRAPVVFPQRIDYNLCKTLEKYNKVWINTQFNHPREVTQEVTLACAKLQKCGIPMSNQSVLLRGINDDAGIMTELCHKLQRIRVRPYYLFQCDPVIGASHFRTSVFKGIDIVSKMRGYTSGMCIPTFIVDGIDGNGKVPLGPDYLVSTSNEGITLKNYKGETFFYPNPKE